MTDYTPNVTNAWDVIDAAASGSSPTPATSNTTLVLINLDESYPFAVGSDVEGQTSGATANIRSKNYPGAGGLNLEIDNITGTFVVGETVQRYKNRNNIATGDITQIDTPAASSGLGSSTPSSPNGFFNDNGYGVVGHGGTLYIVKVLSNLV